MEHTPQLDRDGRPWHPQPAPTFPEGLGIFADEQKARMDAAKTELEQPQKAAPTMSVPDLLQLVEGGPKRKEYGIEMDGIAQMLGLDIFDYDPGDVARAIAQLEAKQWVSCADRLPEDGKVKIVAALTEMSPGRFRHVTLKRTFYYDEEQKGWVRNGQGDSDGIPTTHTITHWQDLPQPPRV